MHVFETVDLVATLFKIQNKDVKCSKMLLCFARVLIVLFSIYN